MLKRRPEGRTPGYIRLSVSLCLSIWWDCAILAYRSVICLSVYLFVCLACMQFGGQVHVKKYRYGSPY
jgi:hypothetical protein